MQTKSQLLCQKQRILRRDIYGMAWLVLICSLILAALDYCVAKRIIGSNNHRALKVIVGVAWALDLMPQIITVVTFIFCRDNPTWLENFAGWAFFAYAITAVARGPFNLVFIVTNSIFIRFLGAALGVTMVVGFTYGAIVTRTDYIINRVVIESERIPQGFSGYTILQLSDLHIGTMLQPEKELSEIIALCNKEKPDLVAITGDIINIRHEELTPSIKAQLRKLQAKDGIYSITGNHDVGVYIKDSLTFTPENCTRQLIAEQRKLGWVVLDNASDIIRNNGDSIYITGISYPKALQDHRHSRQLPATDIKAAYKGVNEECFCITLSHIPQLWDNILQETKSDLTLAGHVHSMQIKFPIGERGISPAMILYKRWSGLYEQEGRWLYINDGIGCIGFPMRMGAKPEITIFELRHIDT